MTENRFYVDSAVDRFHAGSMSHGDPGLIVVTVDALGREGNYTHSDACALIGITTSDFEYLDAVALVTKYGQSKD